IRISRTTRSCTLCVKGYEAYRVGEATGLGRTRYQRSRTRSSPRRVFGSVRCRLCPPKNDISIRKLLCPVVSEFQVEFQRPGPDDGRTRRGPGAYNDSAMGATLRSGIRKELEPLRSRCGSFLAM